MIKRIFVLLTKVIEMKYAAYLNIENGSMFLKQKFK